MFDIFYNSLGIIPSEFQEKITKTVCTVYTVSYISTWLSRGKDRERIHSSVNLRTKQINPSTF